MFAYIHWPDKMEAKERRHDTPVSRLHVLDSLIVMNPPCGVFADGDNKLRSLFQYMFESIDPKVWFCYLKAFNQVRVVFSTEEKAKIAFQQLDGAMFMNEQLKLRQAPEYIKMGSSTLQVPEPDRQFLISPPSTPPVGWRQVREEKPSAPQIEDILEALHLTPADPLVPFQLHPGCANTPSILVHAPDSTEEEEHGCHSRVKMSAMPAHLVQTARPPLPV